MNLKDIQILTSIFTKANKKIFLVGGATRNTLLKQTLCDFDFCTLTTPEENIKILEKNNISYFSKYKHFGAITAKINSLSFHITTAREDIYDAKFNLQEIKFINSIEQDAKRRDFTFNAIYMDMQTMEYIDPTNGIQDLKEKTIKFIGNIETKIQEDPIRILRALRFKAEYDLNFLNQELYIQTFIKYSYLLKNANKTKILYEIKKIKKRKRATEVWAIVKLLNLENI